jgi:hypothetical protein
VYKFWNKFKKKINHGFALTYNTLKKNNANEFEIYISTISNITADTVVIFFTLALVERRNSSNSNNIRDFINYLKKGFCLERDIFL